MGGSSKSTSTASQTTNNNQQIQTTTTSLEDVAFGIAGNEGDVSVTQVTTDHGAIAAARDIGSSAFDFAGEFASELSGEAFAFGGRALDAVSKTSEESTRTLAGAIEQAGAQTRSDVASTFNQLGKYGAIAFVIVGGIVALVLLKKKG